MTPSRMALLASVAVSLGIPPATLSGQATAAQAPQRRPIVSPDIQPDHRVTFRLAAAKATEVILNGDWEGENSVPMKKDDQGVWSATVGPLAPELWSYTFTVDGVRTLDPTNVDNYRDGQRLSSIFIIPGPASAIYAHNPGIPHGFLHQVWYPATSLKMTRRAYIYTPPGYESGAGRYPVLYLHPGGGADEDAWTSLGRLPQIMDGLIAQGKARPMIVVMQNINPRQWAAPGYALLARETEAPPAGPQPAGRTQRATPNWPLNEGHTAIGESLVKDLIPFVEKNYRVDREGGEPGHCRTVPGRRSRCHCDESLPQAVRLHRSLQLAPALRRAGPEGPERPEGWRRGEAVLGQRR